MRSVATLLFALALWECFTPTAAADWPCCCPIPIIVGYEMRPVICYRPEWREEQVPCTIDRVNWRREVTQVQTTALVAREFDERVRTAYYVPVPREVERQVPYCVMAPVMMFDPCTCCCFVTYCPQWTVARVRCVEYDYRREEREAIVRVCRWVPEPQLVDHVRWIPEVTREPSFTVRRYCVMVPYQSAVCVPIIQYCCMP